MEKFVVKSTKSSVSCSARMDKAFIEAVRYFAYCFFYFFGFLNSVSKGSKNGFTA